MIQPKPPKVGKTAKYPQWALRPARRWTTDFPLKNVQNRVWTRICLEPKSHHVRTRTDTIGTLVSSEPRPLPRLLPRSLRMCRDHVQITSECWSALSLTCFTFKCTGIHLWTRFSSGATTPCLQTRWDSPLNAILPRSQITSPSNTLGSRLKVYLFVDGTSVFWLLLVIS